MTTANSVDVPNPKKPNIILKQMGQNFPANSMPVTPKALVPAVSPMAATLLDLLFFDA